MLAVCVMLVAGVVLGRAFSPGGPAVGAAARMVVDARQQVTPIGDIVGAVINENFWSADDPVHPNWHGNYLGRTIARVRDLSPSNGRKFAVRFGQTLTDGQWGKDGYDWQAAFDPKRWDTSVDEFLDYVGLVGGEPYLGVNFGSRTAREAGGLVAYVNGTDPNNQFVQMRIQRGREEPYNVRHWILGFEQYGQWVTGNLANRAFDFANPQAQHGGDPEWFGKPSSNPQFFAARAAQFVREMRSASTIPIEISTPFNNWDLTYWGGPEDSVKAIAGGLGDAVDGLALRFYPASPVHGETDADLLGRPETLADKLDMLRTLLLREEQTDKKLAISDVEYNNRYGGTTDQTHQLVNGLFVADTLRVLASKGVSSAFYFAISAPAGNGSGYSYFEQGDVERAMPTYLATQLVARHLGAEVVASDVSRSRVATADGGKSGSFSYPTLTVLPSLSSDRKTLYLVVINKHLMYDQQTEVNLQGVRVSGQAQIVTLTGLSPQAQAGEVSVSESIRGIGNSFTYSFPAHSVTGLVIPLSVPVP